MEHRERKNKYASMHLMDAQFLKKVTQLVLSVSVFSFLFSHQSLISLLHNFNFYFAKFPYQVVTHTIDKNCIFLLCNGLLVFVAKYSGLIRSLSRGSNRPDLELFSSIASDASPPDPSLLAEGKQMILENNHDESFIMRSITGDSPPESSMPTETKEMIVDKKIAEESITGSEEVLANVPAHKKTENECLVVNQPEKETEKAIVEEEEEEPESKYIISNGEREEEEETDEKYVTRDDEEEQKWLNGSSFVGQTVEEEEEVNAKLSTEELNKKFDDFIRRMKAEIRIEAQTQLIMV